VAQFHDKYYYYYYYYYYVRSRGYFSKPKEVGEQKCLGKTSIGLAALENSEGFKVFNPLALELDI
jgi:hypothetical protein